MENKENRFTQKFSKQAKKISPFPQLEKPISSSTVLKEKSAQHDKDISCNDILINTVRIIIFFNNIF